MYKRQDRLEQIEKYLCFFTLSDKLEYFLKSCRKLADSDKHDTIL